MIFRILDDRLFIGTVSDPVPPGITAVLNVSSRFGAYPPFVSSVLWMPTNPAEFHGVPWFQKASDYLCSNLQGVVLIQDDTATSRAPAVAMLSLMVFAHLTLAEAEDVVLMAQPSLNVHGFWMNGLREFERTLGPRPCNLIPALLADAVFEESEGAQSPTQTESVLSS